MQARTARTAAFAAAVMLLFSGDRASAQANGDPGAAQAGQARAEQGKPSGDTKPGAASGANAMSKGASGGNGGPSTTSGSNSGSGSGKVDPTAKR